MNEEHTVDRHVVRLLRMQRKLAKRDHRIAGLERRIGQLETLLAERSLHYRHVLFAHRNEISKVRRDVSEQLSALTKVLR